MTILCVGTFLFTSSMLMNVTYGLMTGIGTIDRLKKKATNTMSQSDEECKSNFFISNPSTCLIKSYDKFDSFC